jgi:hypothetical protein
VTGRCCHAIELNAAYVDVAVLRWQDFTGQAAVLEGDEPTFAEIAAAELEEWHDQEGACPGLATDSRCCWPCRP